MRRFTLISMAGVWALTTASLHAQQSLGEAMRHAHALPGIYAETQGLSAPPATLEEALHSLYERADVVFTGEVTSVQREDDGIVVTFRVDDGIRAVTNGSMYVLREWSGLWTDDATRYVVGERRLMLLHASAVSGFASPAGGMAGAIHLHGDAVQGTADLRWVAAQVAIADAVPTVAAFAQTLPLSDTNERAPSAADHSAMDGAVVTGMLHAWQRAETVQ